MNFFSYDEYSEALFLQVVNHHLLRDLTEYGLWNDDMKNEIIAKGGSVQVSCKQTFFVRLGKRKSSRNCLFQNIDSIPQDLKDLYKTVWEISQKKVIQMAADRGAFIDQSQSLNIHIAEPNYGKLTSMHFFAWKLVSLFKLYKVFVGSIGCYRNLDIC